MEKRSTVRCRSPPGFWFLTLIKTRKHKGEWTATGAQFAHPYVFKTLFSREQLDFIDYCEQKAVTTEMHLDMNEFLPEGEHEYHFVGKVGLFVPVIPGNGGGLLMRKKEDKYNAISGTKGYRWLEASIVKENMDKYTIDNSYYETLTEKAIELLSTFGSFENFIS